MDKELKDYRVIAKHPGTVHCFMKALKSSEKRMGTYDPGKYDLRGRVLFLKNMDPCNISNLAGKYGKCKIYVE